MKRLKSLLFAAPLLLAGACVDVNAPIEMYAICAPPDADACEFASSCDAQYIGENVVDVANAQNYWLFVEVHNQLANNGDASIGRVNTNNAYIQEVTVNYRGFDLDPITHLQQSVVPSEGSSVISVFAMAESTLGQLGGLAAGTSVVVVAEVTAKGLLADGTEFEGAPWDVPITVCNGCLGAFGCADPTQLVATCPPTPIGAQLPATYACVTP